MIIEYGVDYLVDGFVEKFLLDIQEKGPASYRSNPLARLLVGLFFVTSVCDEYGGEVDYIKFTIGGQEHRVSFGEYPNLVHPPEFSNPETVNTNDNQPS